MRRKGTGLSAAEATGGTQRVSERLLPYGWDTFHIHETPELLGDWKKAWEAEALQACPLPHIFPFPRFCPACAEAKKARFYFSSLLFIIWYITNPFIPIGLFWAWDMAGRKHWFGQILDSEFKTKQWLSVCKAQEMIKCASSPEKSINISIMDLDPELVWRREASPENLALLLQEDWDMS